MKQEDIGVESPEELRGPRATYRFQFHRDFTLRRAIQLVPYLAELGVSHIYASPLTTARCGSLHGYEVCDYLALNPEIGTPDDLRELVRELHVREMGLVLDIVPNHMGIGGRENRWWWDVLQKGHDSPYSTFFDIDWTSPDPRLRGKVLIPILGEPYSSVLERGELRIAVHNAEPVIRYFDHEFPVSPDSRERAERLASKNSDNPTDPSAIDEVLQLQHYRLCHWQHGDAELNYRRFFNVATLAGVRVEDKAVFDHTHETILEWHRNGWIDGLRIDHPDGLRDPGQYFERLNKAAPGAWIVAEKVLEPGESLPDSWPIAGTTGYDFAAAVSGLFVNAGSENTLTQFYVEFTGQGADFSTLVRMKKREVLNQLFVSEIRRLTRLLIELAAKHWEIRDCTIEEFSTAIVEIAAAFPVYRTYTQPGGTATPEDAARVRDAIREARRSGLPANLLDFIEKLLCGRVSGEVETEFMTRFQQLTGPAMAKGVEDTAFYCFNRFVALNEVGGDPGRFGVSTRDFHEHCAKMFRRWPRTMLASSTHDTKRSEDVRARLVVLSEIPEQWIEAVRRWSGMNEGLRKNNQPDRNSEYLFYQTVVGAWPLDRERAWSYMQKAAREAKQHTTWTSVNSSYEDALKEFVFGALSNPDFVAEVSKFVETLRPAYEINILAMTLLKLTCPGVPDFYQGTELPELSLVDPDNRRAVDYESRQRLLSEAASINSEEVWARRTEGFAKLWLIRKTLKLRTERPDLFAGEYAGIEAAGARKDFIIAAMRGRNLLVMIPRFALSMQGDWMDTNILFPEGGWRNEFTGETFDGGRWKVRDIFNRFPVALFVKLTFKSRSGRTLTS